MRQSRYNVWVEYPSADYVYNGVSGALLRAPSGTREAVRRVTGDVTERGCPPKLLEQMAYGRMLVSDDVDERDLLSTRYELSRHDPAHFAVTVVTSLGCNFDCPYCFEDKHPSIMSTEVQDAVVAMLDDQLPQIRQFQVTWFGGEPLVGKQPLLSLSDRFIERCDAMEVDYQALIVTNGYLLDAQMCEALSARRVTDVQVSLDGPAHTHDRMRPLAGGGPSFERIVANLHHAVEHFSVGVRMNVDTANFGHAEELFQRLADEGLAGRLAVYPGQIVGVDEGPTAPSTNYTVRCFTNPEFAAAELEFVALAAQYGLSKPSVPSPAGAPCTAVRENEVVVGSEGELYKCWDSVGNPREVIGSIFDHRTTNNRLRKWLAYDPFADEDCRSCIALPVCMGGCAHHAFDLIQHENRCGTFRTTYREQVSAFVETAERDGLPDADGMVQPAQLSRRMETR